MSTPYSTLCILYIFFFNDTATTEIYTLSLHDALPISLTGNPITSTSAGTSKDFTFPTAGLYAYYCAFHDPSDTGKDRKSTRLNSSHVEISYAVFCLKKKNI